MLRDSQSHKKSYKKKNSTFYGLLLAVLLLFLAMPMKDGNAGYDPHIWTMNQEDPPYHHDLPIDDYTRIRQARSDSEVQFKTNKNLEYLIEEIRKEISSWILKFKSNYLHSPEKSVMMRSVLKNYALNVLSSGRSRSMIDCIYTIFTNKQKADAKYKYFLNKIQRLLICVARNDFKGLSHIVMELGAMVRLHNINPMNEWFIALCEALPKQIMTLRFRRGISDLRAQVNRIRELDDKVFIFGKRIRLKEEDEVSLACEVALLFAPKIRREMEMKLSSEEQIMECLDKINWNIKGFVSAFAKGNYKVARTSLAKIITVAKDKGIEDVGRKCAGFLRSFPAVTIAFAKAFKKK